MIARWSLVLVALVAPACADLIGVDDWKPPEPTGAPCDTVADCTDPGVACSRPACTNGHCADELDDTDVPLPADACHVGACVDGAPAQTPASAGTACGTTHTLACDDQGRCTGCADASECGLDTPCIAYACATGVCAADHAPAGHDTGDQTEGDCKRRTCDGEGGVVEIADDADVADDANPCTDDSCSGGLASHPFSPSGTPCGAGTCDGAGTCNGCSTDADCGKATACATPTCAQAKCSVTSVPAGQGDPGGQVPNDCKRVTCDGNGGVTTVPDDLDVPADDGLECTGETCSNGSPIHPPSSQGTQCTNGTCNGAGLCAECTTNADCSGGDACSSAVCGNGSCAIAPAPSGPASPSYQNWGDCQMVMCDGAGSAYTVPDDMDPPPPQDDCNAYTCFMGQPQTLYTTDSCGNGCGTCMLGVCNCQQNCVPCP